MHYLMEHLNNTTKKPLNQNNMKETAVEWLEKRYNDPLLKDNFISQAEFQKAKEMEKEQKIEFANNYGFDICGYDYERAEQYYKETFKSE